MALPVFPVGLWSSTYVQRVLALGGANTVAFWPFWKTATAEDLGPGARNAVYGGTVAVAGDPGDGRPALSLVGTGRANLSAIASVFDGNTGAVSMWLRVAGAGTWTDGVARYALRLFIDASNEIWLRKPTGSNSFAFAHIAGGTTKTASVTMSPTAWFHVALSWSAANGVQFWVDGALLSTLTSPGVWSGASLVTALVGALTTGNSSPWSGSIGRVLVLNRAVVQADVDQLRQIT
jgi:hypothetical protein